MNEKELRQTALAIRRDILRMIYLAGSGHPGGSLSSVEILTALYFTDCFRCRPEEPKWPERDWFLLSKGHCAPVLYSVLARKGFFDISELDSLRQMGSILQGHPNARKTPGLDCSSGSLGQGLSIAGGLAYAFRRQGRENRVYCLLGDGELQEGQIWEAAMFAAHHELGNVCAVVDYNKIQLDGAVENIKGIVPLREKWAAFGWNVLEADGHSLRSMYNCYQEFTAGVRKKPTVILAHTAKGKGISFMQDKAAWHGAAPNDRQYAQALAELEVAE